MTEPVLGSVRLDCGIPGANRSQVAEYNRRHRPNENPIVASLQLQVDGEWLEVSPAAEEPVLVSAGAAVPLVVEWPACEEEAPCGGAETYVQFDAASGAIVTRTELMLVSWFASGGSFDSPRSGPSGEQASSAEGLWHAPEGAGAVDLWIVLRDGRGGVGSAAWRVEVR